MSKKRLKKVAACTQPPWAPFIEASVRADTLRKIREECVEKLGYNLDECPKRKTCFTDTCTGRPLPWFSKTAKPYLEKLAKETSTNPNTDLFVSTDCSPCPFFKECNSPCNQVIDYIERTKTAEPTLYYYDKLESVTPNLEVIEESLSSLSTDNIPWDCISERKRKVIKERLFKEKNFSHVAENTNLYNNAAAKLEYYSGLTKLSKYGVIRKFFKENKDLLTDKQRFIIQSVFVENKKVKEVAKTLNVTTQAVYLNINKVIEKHNLKWKTYVKIKDRKVIYNISEIVK